MQIWQLIVAGVLVHLVLFYSIFDIYFTTPLVHGMTPVESSGKPPAKRLFLFVTDGLRADKFYEPDDNGDFRAPFLRNIMEKEGVWGVSHTRVPTESRPGHVALIAGFYEDVSAVAKGWKENPVEFDSVFNESRYTWSWGSPDILPMFSKGATGQHVIIDCYSAEFEDFAGSDKTMLDTWVFDKVEEFFSSASSNSTLKQLMDGDRLVFFLHLLGVDTHGHSSKPHSREYLDNIKLVDAGIKKTVEMVNKFYRHDEKTAFVVTSDHGMTDWGSHGAGHDHETLTPFVAWGAGIRQPVVGEHCGIRKDEFCTEWQMQKIKRTDMEQADVAPLMSSLIGISFPLNSVGKLPIDVLSASIKDQAELLLNNALQILAQYQVKMDQVKDRSISVTFRPFKELREAEKLQSVKHIRQLIRTGHYQESINEIDFLIDKALRGLRYYQTYDRLFLGVSIVLGFGGWMVYVMSILTFDHTATGRETYKDYQTNTVSSYIFGLLTVAIIALLYIQKLPLMCYVYCLLPIFPWYKSTGWLVMVLDRLYNLELKGQLIEALLSVFFCVLGLEIARDLLSVGLIALAFQSLIKLHPSVIVRSRGCTVQLLHNNVARDRKIDLFTEIAAIIVGIFSFYYRELLSVGLIALAFRPLIKLHHSVIVSSKRCSLAGSHVGWLLSCLIMAIFPLMPVVGKDTHYDWILYGGILAVVLGIAVYSRLAVTATRFTKGVLLLQLSLVAIAVMIVLVTANSIQQRKGLPWPCQIGSWSILVLSCVLPLLTPTTIGERLFSLSLSFLASYLLLSIAYEVFFFVSLSSFLYFWLRTDADGKKDIVHKNIEQIDFLQHEESKDNLSCPTSVNQYMELPDIHRAFIFIFLIVTAFFGTGNIASINSFDPAAVYCFLTVFNPFLMGALLMLKNIIPFLLVTCALRAIVVVTHTSLRSLILIVLLMSDFMGLHFFFLVVDEGSWLEIGTTISHYVIVMAIINFILLLLGASHLLTCLSLPALGLGDAGGKHKAWNKKA